MMFSRYLFVNLLICLLGSSQPSFAQSRPINFSELEATVSEELRATKAPGAAVSVVIGDRVVFSKGIGVADIETGSPVNSETLFRIASSTKMLTAAAALILAEEGKIKLDVPIGKYVQGLSPRLARLTVHQLLSHTAGLRDGASFYGPHDDGALANFVSTWTDDYLIAEPGEMFSYSNLGLILTARVLESASGKSYADLMNEVLFQPLGMRRTTLRPDVAMTYPLAQGHDIPSGQPNLMIVRPFADDARYWPAGGVFTSVADFSRFAIAFLNGGQIDGRQALSPAVIKKLSTPYVDVPGGNIAEHPRHAYGLNVRDYRGVRVLQHGGLRIGFGSLVRFVPEHHFAVIILVNKTNGLLLKTFEKATELAVPLQTRTISQPRSPITMSEAEMQSYAGLYQNAPDYLTVELFVKDRKLLLKQIGESGMTEVIKVGDNVFNAGGQEFQLITTRNRKAKYLHIAAHALRRM